MGFSIQQLQRALFTSVCIMGIQSYAYAQKVSSSPSFDAISITLDKIEMIQQKEKNGDELYFEVTQFTEGQMPLNYQVPNFPSHWLSKYLNNVKNIVLWKKTFDTCKNTDVLISLIEEDYPPWNLNDELGSVKFHISCENGQIKTVWSIPDPKNTMTVHDQNTYLFFGKKSKYQVTFEMKDEKIQRDEKEIEKEASDLKEQREENLLNERMQEQRVPY